MLELPTLANSAENSLKISKSFHVLMSKFENLPGYGNLFPIYNECTYKHLPDCCKKSPWLQDANLDSSATPSKIFPLVLHYQGLPLTFQWLAIRTRRYIYHSFLMSAQLSDSAESYLINKSVFDDPVWKKLPDYRKLFVLSSICNYKYLTHWLFYKIYLITWCKCWQL